MSADTLLALAERCEAATGPDKHLNLAIANAMYGDDLAPSGTSHGYTSSVDAALTLVPEGWDWSAGTDKAMDLPAWANLTPVEQPYPVEAEKDGQAATPALAICAAALRAIAAVSPSVRKRSSVTSKSSSNSNAN